MRDVTRNSNRSTGCEKPEPYHGDCSILSTILTTTGIHKEQNGAGVCKMSISLKITD